MRRILSLFVLLLVWCVACVPLTSPPSQPIDPILSSSDPMDVTVALVSDEDLAYCAGTWVSANKILTASHCVIDNETDAVSKSVHFRDHDGVISEAKVTKVERRADLALLETALSHTWAPLARSWHKGEELTIVGHPNQAEWAFMRGWISLWLKHDSPESDGQMGMLQVQAPVWYGNSGGGAFDVDGALVGVCSMFSVDVPDLGLFVAPEEIAAFLLTK